MASASITAYTSTLSGIQSKAASYVSTALNAFLELNPDVDAETLTEFAAETLAQAVRVYGDQAAVVACQTYDQVAAQAKIQAQTAEIANEYGTTQAYSRAASALTSSNGNLGRFISTLSSAAADKALFAANKTIAANADRDYSSGIRWARVPSGRETCGFCVMLASRGFVYTSAEAAGETGGMYNRYHDHCDCIAWPGTEDTVVDGYDPDWYYSVYKDACGTAGYDTTPGIAGTHGKTDVDAICREISKRSASWVYGKQSGAVTLPEGASELAQATATVLAGHGFDVTGPAVANGSLDLTMGGRSYSIQSASGTASIATALAASRAARAASRTGQQSGGAASTILVASAGVTASDVLAAMEQGEETLIIYTDGSLRRLSK